jgi:flagellar protein FliO/FliZ
MQWLSDLLPFGDNKVLQIAVLVACGIAALVVLAIVYRLVFAHRLRVPGGRTRQPRLGLVDAFSLDGQRQLVLVRRDNVEHLVMIGGPNDVLIETQINRALAPAREGNHVAAAASPARRADSVAAPEAAPVPQPAPRPVVAQQPVVAPQPVVTPRPAATPAPAQPKPAGPISGTVIPSSVTPKPMEPAPVRAPQPGVVTPSSGATVQPATAVAPAAQPSRAGTQGPSTPAGSRLNAPSGPVTPRTAETPAATVPSVSPPRPLPARPMMPPPIIPAQRGEAGQPSDKQPPAPAVLPSKALAPTPAAGLARAEPAPSNPVKTPEANFVKAPPPVIYVQPNPSAPTAKTEARLEKQAPESGAAQSAPLPRPAETGGTPTHGGDPFADLETLEAEMARLLGRDKLN